MSVELPAEEAGAGTVGPRWRPAVPSTKTWPGCASPVTLAARLGESPK